MCRARVAANQTFTISSKDLEGSEVNAGDAVRVLVTKDEKKRNFRPRDRDIFDTTVQKTGQIRLPNDTVNKLNIETGDTIQYLVVPKHSFPGIEDGPVREAISGGEAGEQMERPERESTQETFSDKPMQKTGQITVPSEIMDKMGLLQGDSVTATIEWQGESETLTLDIGTGHRITIPKDTRDNLGLEPGDQPTITLTAFD